MSVDTGARRGCLTVCICVCMHMYYDGSRCLPGPGRPHPPAHRRGAAQRRAAGQRHRRPSRDPPIRGLAPFGHPARSRLRLGAAGRTATALLSQAGAVPRAGRVAREVSRLVGRAPRPLGSRARAAPEGTWNNAQGATHMSDKSTFAAAGATRPKVVLERTYRARAEELWDLWTTKEGFESWWGPEGFRVEVRTLEARAGGALHYDMIADAPEQM